MKDWYNEIMLIINSVVVAFYTIFATNTLYDKNFDAKISKSSLQEKKKFYEAIVRQKESGSKDPITVILNNEKVEVIVE